MAAGEQAERDRLRATFARYGRDPRRRQAWASDNPGNVALREELAGAVLAELADHDRGGTLVDLGCGTGWWLERLADAGYPLLVGDARRPPLPDGSCALVTLFTVLSSMAGRAEVAQTLAQARRMVAPGGTVAVWEPRVPTPNPETRLVRARELRAGLGPTARSRSLTLAPPLARRAGRAYPVLARLAPLHSHRLVIARPR
jgi:SAM-dependent methyltransferase